VVRNDRLEREDLCLGIRSIIELAAQFVKLVVNKSGEIE